MPSASKSGSGTREGFEKNLERLDNIVQQLEDADLHLEKALQLFEEGMRLSEVCHKQLGEAEGKGGDSPQEDRRQNGPGTFPSRGRGLRRALSVVSSPKLGQFLEQQRARVDRTLEKLLPGAELVPNSIHRAMRYAVFAGGKRIRPVLCLEAGRLFRDNDGPLLPPASALELIHTYSLIHDDLPALDNDDLRRGQTLLPCGFRRGHGDSGR